MLRERICSFGSWKKEGNKNKYIFQHMTSKGWTYIKGYVQEINYSNKNTWGQGSKMLNLWENYKMFYMVSAKSTHLNCIHYNNKPEKITKAKKHLMKFES
jgi:hypothetical protein